MRTTTHPGLNNKDKNNAVNHTFRHTSADKLVTVMATPEKSHRKKKTGAVSKHAKLNGSVCGPTMKNVMVLPPWMVPYSMLVWSAKSSGDSMGTSILWTVRKAARLAV